MFSAVSPGTWRAATSLAPPSVNVPPLPPAPLPQPLMMTSRGQVQSLWGPRKVKTWYSSCSYCPVLAHWPCVSTVLSLGPPPCSALSPSQPLDLQTPPCCLSSLFLPGVSSPDLLVGAAVVTGAISLHRSVGSAVWGGGHPSEGAGGGRLPEPAHPGQ